MNNEQTNIPGGDLRLQGPVAKLTALKSRCVARQFNLDVYRQAGVFVVQQAVPAETMKGWIDRWNAFMQERLQGARKVNQFNPVALTEDPPEELRAIYREPHVLDIAEQIFGPDVALYNYRFVIKDKNARGPVFRHQDVPYHIGHMERASFFVPLSRVSEQNGAMTFVLGTHHFGYLGDAGELQDDLLLSGWPSITPELEPGDVAIMHSALWHESGPHVSGEDRIMADIHLQPSSDPSSTEIVRGSNVREYQLPLALRNKLFKRSRVSRLTELQKQVDAMQTGSGTAQGENS